jgi:protein phosphatase
MRDGEHLRPNVYRYILEEDGLLLLCSDGLSDRDLVEQYWQAHTEPVMRGHMSLEQAVNGWIKLANEKNGTDNISVVLTRVEVSVKPELVLDTTPDAPIAVDEADLAELQVEPPVTAGEELDVAPGMPKPRRRGWLWGLLALPVIGMGGSFAWSQLDPGSFNPVRDRVQTQVQQWRQQIGR